MAKGARRVPGLTVRFPTYGFLNHGRHVPPEGWVLRRGAKRKKKEKVNQSFPLKAHLGAKPPRGDLPCPEAPSYNQGSREE